ncbi:bifunctional riboflavin kinase/FAD synthetase [Phaeovibrio sulfidiphilus]|uniref:Riboflavin biosynthesis protein n=1 Tax=Phaeovibrio sulfidiphilus TaxID=1220600 RepID=A0A8J6YVS0_9PROT|nr:bifunctional riboflavin kinase/FAD synthetase [Phaeovibrio sulfidiphilus]MBE1236627.1 bifunctional riboflavin kinase/FAD synthetase [Phaeovibrio sulfidiphilus]
MRVVRHAFSLPQDLKGCCLALGNFDGFHLGHQRVIGTARAIARDLAVPLGVMTFEPHPRRYFQPDLPAFALSTFRTKARRIEEEGADFLFAQLFDETLAMGSAAWFVEEILVRELEVCHVVVGHDYGFGKNREGDVPLLQSMGLERGFGVTAVMPVLDEGGEIVSSTRVRNALRQGQLTDANALLGHPWEMDGRVEHGDARGRTIGFPTANLKPVDLMAPAMGVYAITAGVDKGPQTQFLKGVANFGLRPTFGGTEPVMEVFLFDFSGDLYGQTLRVRFHHYLRPEQSFSGIDALKAQIAADVDAAHRLLEGVV